MNTHTILSGHVSPETAYVVNDYPYGFRLRCKIRYWLEYKPGKGFRFWSQTSNPKRGDVWNKPKSSTYCRFGGCMFLDDQGHVQWDGCHEYMDVKELINWRTVYGAAMPEDGQKLLNYWIMRKLSYEQAKNEGQVKCTMTTTEYGCITDPDFGKNPVVSSVETTVLKSDYSPAELVAMGQSKRADIGAQLARL